MKDKLVTPTMNPKTQAAVGPVAFVRLTGQPIGIPVPGRDGFTVGPDLDAIPVLLAANLDANRHSSAGFDLSALGEQD